LGEGWDEERSKKRIMNLNSNPTLTLTLSQRERGLKQKKFSPCTPHPPYKITLKVFISRPIIGIKHNSVYNGVTIKNRYILLKK
jgi:hypothetical protein